VKKTKTFTNADVAKLLRNVSAAYQVKDEQANRFKTIAYDRAATAVENATSEIKDLWEEKKLNTISGVGGSIAGHIDELFKTGKVKHFQEVLSGLPKAMFEFLKLKGIGPKTALKLCLSLRIKNSKGALERLKIKARTGQIGKLAGFGKDSEKSILNSLNEYLFSGEKEKRMLLSYAEELSSEILNYLRTIKEVKRADPLGSLRRKCATIGDIDIAVSTTKPDRVINQFIKFPGINRVLKKGKRGISALLDSGKQIDLIAHPPKAYGSLLQHFTGSKHHNIHLRELANKKGLSLSEYGITKLNPERTGNKTRKQDPKKRIAFETEENFYHFLGMDWIPPELREDQGEIEASLKHDLPKLIQLKNLKGDLHLHSDFETETSHDLGQDTMDDFVKNAVKVGYRYLAFAEHNPSRSRHKDSDIISILKGKKSLVDKKKFSWNKSFNIWVLNALEVDIRPDGELAIPMKAFDYLDFVIVSIHSSFNLSREEMTQRILRGLSHPKAKILAHPTGRLLGLREGYEADWKTIFDFCVKKEKAVEINAYPRRLDLPDVLVREAAGLGVKIVINSDSHSLTDMDFIKHGVSVARKGWLEAKNVINTWTFTKLSRFLQLDLRNFSE